MIGWAPTWVFDQQVAELRVILTEQEHDAAVKAALESAQAMYHPDQIGEAAARMIADVVYASVLGGIVTFLEEMS